MYSNPGTFSLKLHRRSCWRSNLGLDQLHCFCIITTTSIPFE